MKVLAVVHLYPPAHNAGAEWMLHSILRDLISRGHEATVVFPGAETYELDEVRVSPMPADLAELARKADVVFTHLDRTKEAARAATQAERPIVHLVHNDKQLNFHNVTPSPTTMVVANSEWIYSTISEDFNRVIVRPPVFVDDYQADPRARDCVTLVNLSNAKGSPTFYRLAAAEPNRNFLAVLGAYGIQDRRRARALRNVEVLPNTSNIVQDVYARTRVLLMPSNYESWGRVGIEAASSGIPTIAHPTPGLLESLGEAGIFADRDDHDRWLRELQRLDDPTEYATAAARALFRANELSELCQNDLDRFVVALDDLCHQRAWVREIASAS